MVYPRETDNEVLELAVEGMRKLANEL